MCACLPPLCGVALHPVPQRVRWRDDAARSTGNRIELEGRIEAATNGGGSSRARMPPQQQRASRSSTRIDQTQAGGLARRAGRLMID